MSKKKSNPKIIEFTERGLGLLRSVEASYRCSPNFGKVSFKIGDRELKVGDVCPQCKKRVRGLNHKEGAHHEGISLKKR